MFDTPGVHKVLKEMLAALHQTQPPAPNPSPCGEAGPPAPATPGAGSHLLHVTPEMQHVGESFFLPGFLLGLLPCLLFLFASSLLLPVLAVGQEGMDGDLVG